MRFDQKCAMPLLLLFLCLFVSYVSFLYKYTMKHKQIYSNIIFLKFLLFPHQMIYYSYKKEGFEQSDGDVWKTKQDCTDMKAILNNKIEDGFIYIADYLQICNCGISR